MGFVPNPGGGFMGFWWHWRSNRYLQLEKEKLCFKIEVSDKDLQAAQRDDWHRRIMALSGQTPLDLAKPSRFGKGIWMTAAIASSDYRKTDADGRLDVEDTLAVLRDAERVMDSAAGGAQ